MLLQAIIYYYITVCIKYKSNHIVGALNNTVHNCQTKNPSVRTTKKKERRNNPSYSTHR